jgi:RNA polymerase sigma-70 factor (ECF subfamily)
VSTELPPRIAAHVRDLLQAMSQRGADFDHEAALLACARGERAALKQIYDREARWLLGVVLRIVRDRATAEDVLQDAFLQVWRRAETYRPDLGSARGWIYTVVRHQALSEVRKPGREIALDDEAMAAAVEHHSHSSWDGGGFTSEAAALQPCLEALDEPKRNSIVLAFVEGYTHDQIAKALGTPLGTVKSWIRRGLQSLKECLS